MTRPSSTAQYQSRIAGRRLVWNTRWASFVGGIVSLLLQRRERRRHDDLARLSDQLVAPARRRPDARLAPLLPDGQPLVHALVGPDVDEPVRGPELHPGGQHQRRELDPLADGGLPALRDAGQRARHEAVAPDLEDRAQRARRDVGDEGQRRQDLHVLVDDEVTDLGGPVRILGGLGPDARALGEILVAPHMDDLVERADLGAPEGGERRVLLAVLVGLAVALLHLGQAAGLERVGPELVDHRRSPILRLYWYAPSRHHRPDGGTREVCAPIPETSSRGRC